MTEEEIEEIRKKVEDGSPFHIMVDRRRLLEAHDAHVKAFKGIIKALVHGRSVAKDMQEAVRLASEAIGEPINPFFRDCSTDPDEG